MTYLNNLSNKPNWTIFTPQGTVSICVTDIDKGVGQKSGEFGDKLNISAIIGSISFNKTTIYTVIYPINIKFYWHTFRDMGLCP